MAQSIGTTAVETNETNETSETNECTIITNQVPGYYKCGHCALHFKTRARFQAHETTCLSLKQIRARATFASVSEHATTSDLLAIVQQLALRLETVENELNTVKRQQQHQVQHQQQKNQIHRGNLLQWLNGTTAGLNGTTAQLNGTTSAELKPFSQWLTTIPAIRRNHLELVFQHGFMDGMCAIIASITNATASAGSGDGYSTCPLRAYDEAPSTMFVYEEPLDENECMGKAAKLIWRPMTHAEFEKLINRMQKLLMNEFVRWQQEHMSQLHDPDFAEKYDTNLLKVTGSGKAKSGGCSNRDMLITRMKPKVYAAIKRSANGLE